jgi:hypothetical protein
LGLKLRAEFPSPSVNMRVEIYDQAKPAEASPADSCFAFAKTNFEPRDTGTALPKRKIWAMWQSNSRFSRNAGFGGKDDEHSWVR